MVTSISNLSLSLSIYIYLIYIYIIYIYIYNIYTYMKHTYIYTWNVHDHSTLWLAGKQKLRKYELVSLSFDNSSYIWCAFLIASILVFLNVFMSVKSWIYIFAHIFYETIYCTTLCLEEIQHQQKKIKIVENIDTKTFNVKLFQSLNKFPSSKFPSFEMSILQLIIWILCNMAN